MLGEFALMMVTMWPLIPMFFIQVHFAPNFWRRLGIWTYFLVFLEWVPVAYIIRLLQDEILRFEISIVTPILVIGVFLVAGGIVLHGWTAQLLGIKTTLGYTELHPKENLNHTKLITSGPFSVVRHPSYWAHTLILTGTFLMTGVFIVGIIAILDVLISYLVTVQLEERELVERFGDQYREYQRNVPKFFPSPPKSSRDEVTSVAVEISPATSLFLVMDSI